MLEKCCESLSIRLSHDDVIICILHFVQKREYVMSQKKCSCNKLICSYSM